MGLHAQVRGLAGPLLLLGLAAVAVPLVGAVKDVVVPFLDDARNVAYILAPLAAFLAAACMRGKRWPELRDIIELAAYGSGVFAAVQWIAKTYSTKDVGVDLGMASGAAVAVAAYSIQRIVEIIRDAGKPPRAGHPGGAGSASDAPGVDGGGGRG